MQVGQVKSPPFYQRIAPQSYSLRQLGLHDSAIARRLGVSDKTIAKAIQWRLEQRRPGPK